MQYLRLSCFSQEQYPHAKLPAVQKSFSVPVLGTFHLTVDEIAIGQLSLDPAKTGIILSPDGSKLVLSAAEVTSSATCHFHLVRHPFSSRSGPMQLKKSLLRESYVFWQYLKFSTNDLP